MKQTKVIEITQEEMDFVSLVFGGTPQYKAYLKAFGTDITDESAMALSTKLLKTPHIKAEMKRVREEYQKERSFTVYDKIEFLEQVINDDTQAMKDRLKALDTHNRMLGHNAPEKIETTGTLTHSVDPRISDALDQLFKK